MDASTQVAKPNTFDDANPKVTNNQEITNNGEQHPQETRNGEGEAHPSYPHEVKREESEDTGSGEKEKRGEKQVKPNKVYIGGLPEHTRQEDLQNCFGKIGNIVAIELKLGYGFVEFDSREAAEESVAKYHEGYFMGNKIRVELSHGGGRTAKYAGEPGACFKCGQQGHWARECPTSNPNGRRSHDDRGPPPHGGYPIPPKDYLRDEYGPPSRYYPPATRDARYGPDPLAPPPRDYRDYRPPRPLSPPRDYRDYPGPPPVRHPRDLDDYRLRAPPPPPPPAVRYDSRYPYYPPDAAYRDSPVVGYPRPGYPSPAARDPYERRIPPERYAYPNPATTGGRPPRSPPGPTRPPRDDYDRPPPSRDFPPPPADYRGRGSSPPRFTEERSRYRRRSQSPGPPARSTAPGYVEPGMGYPPTPPQYGNGPRPPARDDYRTPDRNGRP